MTRRNKSLTNLYYVQNPDKLPNFTDLINIASFDPGSRNLGVRIEQRWTEEKPWDRTRLVFLAKWDLKGDGVPVMVSCVMRLHERLKSIADYLSKCHYILVERQMPTNPTAYRIAQHIITQCWGYIQDNGLNTWLIELNSRLKGERLHAPRGVNIKQWSIEEAKHLSMHQNDHETYKMLTGKGKRDEYSDTTIQVQAWLIECGLVSEYQPSYRQVCPGSTW